MTPDDHDPMPPDEPKREPRPQLPHEYAPACGAKTRDGGICTQPAMSNGRCRLHGGKAAKGIKAGAFRHGRRSKALAKLDEDLGDRVNDPKLLDPRRTIAVQESVVARLAEMLDERDSPEFRQDAYTLYNQARELLAEGDGDGAARTLDRLGGTLRRGVEESRALMAMHEAADKMNKSQIRFWQTATHASRAMSPEEFVQYMFRMADIIEGEVDRDAAKRILGRADRELCGGALGLGGRETA